MWKRLASWLGVAPDGGSNKRRRISEEEEEEEDSPASFQDINADCKVHILSFLSTDDMNSFAECNRECRRIRANETLNQTRKGTIIWRPETNILSFFRIAQERGWNAVFSGNRTHLRVLGVCAPGRAAILPETRMRERALFTNVSKLDVSCDCDAPPHHAREEGTINPRNTFAGKLFRMASFPNMRELNMSYLAADPSEVVSIGLLDMRNTGTFTRLIWNGSTNSIILNGFQFEYLNLTHLSVNDSCLPLLHASLRDFEDEQGKDAMNRKVFMFMYCKRLESLSIKGSTWRSDAWNNDDPVPITQAMLIKMVRNHPTLRWLRSDLTEENIAMLKQERPEVTFVSE